MADLKHEIVSLQWVTRIIRWGLDQAIDGRHQFRITQIPIELEDIKKFENMTHDKIQGPEIELEDSNTATEKEVLLNEIGALKCVLDHLFKLNSAGDKIRVTETVEDQLANRLRKQLRCKMRKRRLVQIY